MKSDLHHVMIKIVQTCVFMLFMFQAGSPASSGLRKLGKCYTRHFGCYYLRRYDQCICTAKRGCLNMFKYKTKKDCEVDNFNKMDPCLSNPCHSGICMPKKGWRKYSCDCLETGFYGRHCHKKCPQITLYYAMEHQSHFFEQKDWRRTLLACVFPRPRRTIT